MSQMPADFWDRVAREAAHMLINKSETGSRPQEMLGGQAANRGNVLAHAQMQNLHGKAYSEQGQI